jgi:hypothetical protein
VLREIATGDMPKVSLAALARGDYEEITDEQMRKVDDK